jgi:NADPH-dependent ferric siderophore reductase
MNAAPQVTRVRHDLRRRKLVVSRVETLAPGMRRVVLRGAELAGFTSLGFDDHVKLFFFTGGSEKEMRDFTPRRFDAAAGELWIDFFLHQAGPAAAWAARAVAGQSLEGAGRRAPPSSRPMASTSTC